MNGSYSFVNAINVDLQIFCPCLVGFCFIYLYNLFILSLKVKELFETIHSHFPLSRWLAQAFSPYEYIILYFKLSSIYYFFLLQKADWPVFSPLLPSP